MINAEGALWKEQRRFLHEKLRRFGMTHLSSKNNKLQNMITVSRSMSSRVLEIAFEIEILLFSLSMQVSARVVIFLCF